jgi:probable HAF family extracellular repeat protein
LFSALGLAPRANGDGFELDGTSFTILDYPGSFTVPEQNSTVATGINDEGNIIGTYEDSSGDFNGFLYSNGVFMTIDGAGGNTTLSGINNSGQIVGATQTGGFVYSGGTFTPTLGPNGVALDPRGINNNGQIVSTKQESTVSSKLEHPLLR